MESYFPAEANQYRYDSMMTVDTGASAEGFAPDMGVDPFDDMLPDSSFSSLFPATEPDVAMAQNPLGHHYYSMSSSVQDWQPQWELQQHSRTQSDPGSYISRLNNGQAAFAGGLSAGVSLQDDHRQTIRSASDGQIQDQTSYASTLQQQDLQQQQQQHASQQFQRFRAFDSSRHAQPASACPSGSNATAAPKVAIPKSGSFSTKREESPGGPIVDTGEPSEMTAKRSGPMSANITVPPRPRPGRKPIAQEDAQDRRRFQNRLAQRQFRDKRARKNVELEETLKEQKADRQRVEGEYRNTIATLQARDQEKEQQMQEMKAKTERLERELEELRDVLHRMRSERDQARNSSVGSFRDAAGQPFSSQSYGPGAGTPNSSDYEVDFTNYGRASSNYALQHLPSNDSNAMDFSLDNEDPCGFCTDDQNCACKQGQKQHKAKPTPIEPRISTSMPGSCDMCRSDPERARACREMAAATRPAGKDGEARTASTLDAHRGSSNSSTTMPPPPRVSCSAMVDEFNKFGERTSSISGLFGGKSLTAYPVTKGGYEFDESQAAEVLSTLHRRSEGARSVSSYADSQAM